MTRKYGAYFLFVGRLVSYKGLPYLIQAMGQIQTQMPLNLVIVGEGPEQEALKLEVSRLGLEKRVYFEGRVQDDQDLVSYYRRCEFLVLPSITHAEAFGVVLLEAMRQGKPLITTQLKSGVSEVNPDGVTGFQVRPADSNELARAILRLTTNKQLCAELGEAAKKRFDNQYSLPKMVEAHLSLYQSVLTGS
ncbi:MAG: glycosyltransferase [Bdellovibrio sp.]|nr:glycosyltransferase [Bdellovibrio sp.]